MFCDTAEREREIMFLGKYAAAHRYSEGDRLGRTLAWAVHPASASTDIVQIEGPEDKMLNSNTEILNAFTQY